MSTPINLTTVAKTADSTPQLLFPPNNNRGYLLLQNTGNGGPATFGSDDGIDDGTGFISLDPASAAGGQGGSMEFKDFVPMGAIWVVAGTDTTVVASEG